MLGPSSPPFRPFADPGQDEIYRDNPSMTSPPPVTSPVFTVRDPKHPRLTFRSSVALLPSPGTTSKRHPTYEPYSLKYWVVSLGCLLLILLGIALEVARKLSADHNGFYVPEKNVFSFASTQILTSFFPSLIFVPLALMVHAFDWAIRMWHPYLTLSQGHAPADESLLVDYASSSRPLVTYYALRFKHRFVLISGFTALLALLFQPLAGSIFTVRQFPQSSASSAQSTRAIGLSPNINNLFSFSAAAGYAEASVYNGLSAPPFVIGGWSVAEFVFSTNVFSTGTMAVNTTAIQTDPNCANPNQLTVTPTSADLSTLSATSLDGCSLKATFNPNAATQQYGVVNVPNCGSNTTNPSFQPVFFWFWQQSTSSSAGVFCSPQIRLFDVTAFAFLNNDSLANVTVVDNYPKANNVSGAPLDGIPYNGLIFEPSNDVNVQSRANTILSGIPTAIFRQAEQVLGGPNSVFQDPNGFLRYTRQVYTQHLALATTSNYFVPSNKTVAAEITQFAPRLFVEDFPAHLLGALCFLSGGVMFVLHTFHYRKRRNVYLPHAPGSIGSAVALTSHSGFGELLMPYDNGAAMSRALAPLRFCLDSRTGAIVVDDSTIVQVNEGSAQAARDETMMTLMGRD